MGSQGELQGDVANAKAHEEEQRARELHLQRQNAALVTLEDIQAAAKRIEARIVRTPLLAWPSLNAEASNCLQHEGAAGDVHVNVAFKAEHVQVVGAFKSRGAANAIQMHLERLAGEDKDFDHRRLCVITHSSGNHGAALACQAKQAGVQAAVVMPENAPEVKKRNVASHGARIWYCEPTQDAREAMGDRVTRILQEEGLVVVFIHPYDDPAIIAGQGTMGLEMTEQASHLGLGRGCSYAQPPSSSVSDNDFWRQRSPEQPAFDVVIAPVGGGGMLSGIASAVKGLDPRTIVVGAEPQGADDAHRSFTTNVLQPAVMPVQTICDGLLTSLSQRTLAHIEQRVEQIAVVSDGAVKRALALIVDRTKQLIEPSAAVGLAALMDNEGLGRTIAKIASQRADHTVRVGIVWSGGNTTVGALHDYISAI